MDPVTVSIVVSAPREQVFDYLQDIANHPEFTDHYLVDWHLTRIDSVGARRRRALSREGSRQPLQLGGRHIRGGPASAPHRRGRPHGQEQPHPHARRLRARAGGRRIHARAVHARDRARRRCRIGCWRGSARAPGCGARTSVRCTGCARSSSAGRAAAIASRSPVDRLPRRMFSRLRKLPLALPALLAVLALSACGDSHTGHTGTYAGESGKNAPYLNVGPLIYEVQLSRELNPANSEDATYLQGLTPAQRKLEPGQEWFAVFMQVYNNTPAPPGGDQPDDQPTPRKTSTRRSSRAKPTNSPTAPAWSPPKASSRRPARSPTTTRPRGGAALQDPDRLARQPAAGAEDRRPGRPERIGLRRAGRLTRPSGAVSVRPVARLRALRGRPARRWRRRRRL